MALYILGGQIDTGFRSSVVDGTHPSLVYLQFCKISPTTLIIWSYQPLTARCNIIQVFLRRILDLKQKERWLFVPIMEVKVKWWAWGKWLFGYVLESKWQAWWADEHCTEQTQERACHESWCHDLSPGYTAEWVIGYFGTERLNNTLVGEQ